MRGSVHWGCYYATALDIEVDPQRCQFGCSESDFALQGLVECCALETKPVRVVVLWCAHHALVNVGERDIV